MLSRQKYINKTIEYLNIIRLEIESKSKLNLTDGNIHSESFLCELLNICYAYNLETLDKKIINYPGIDLGDKIKNIGFQVTTTRTSKKINDTLKVCIDNKRYEEFENLKFFIITGKQDSYNITVNYDNLLKFDWKQDIIDFDDLFYVIKNADIDLLEQIYTYVSKNILLEERRKACRPYLRLVSIIPKKAFSGNNQYLYTQWYNVFFNDEDNALNYKDNYYSNYYILVNIGNGPAVNIICEYNRKRSSLPFMDVCVKEKETRYFEYHIAIKEDFYTPECPFLDIKFTDIDGNKYIQKYKFTVDNSFNQASLFALPGETPPELTECY